MSSLPLRDPLSTLCRFSSLVGWRLVTDRPLRHVAAGSSACSPSSTPRSSSSPTGGIIESDQDRLSRWDGEGEDAGAAAIRGLEPIGEIGVVGQPGELEDKVVLDRHASEVHERALTILGACDLS
jgi:hypothetical protein